MRRRAAAAIAVVLLLAGCAARPVTQQGRDRVALRDDVASALLAHARQNVSSGACPADEAYHDDLVGALADFVADPRAQQFDARMLEAIYMEAGRSVSWNTVTRPEVLLEPGPEDALLVVAYWCGRGMGGWTYVIGRSGAVWPVDAPAVDSMGQGSRDPDVRWVGDAWALLELGGTRDPITLLTLVGRQDGGWAVIYPSEDRGLQSGAAIAPGWEAVVAFEDGHQRLDVTWFEEQCGTQVTYEWEAAAQGGRYVETSRRNLTPQMCGPG